MRVIAWVLRLVVFLVILGFALENTEPVVVNFFFGYFLEAPLVVILIGMLLIGCLFGTLLMLPTLLRIRREVGRLRAAQPVKKSLNTLPNDAEAMASPKL